MACLKARSHHLPGETNGNHETTQAGNLRPEPNVSLQCYHYINFIVLKHRETIQTISDGNI
jgi:hypothetical protein